MRFSTLLTSFRGTPVATSSESGSIAPLAFSKSVAMVLQLSELDESGSAADRWSSVDMKMSPI